MPSSRKRNKGKDRKAKQAAEKADHERIMVYNLWSGWANGVRKCDIGKDVTQCHDLITRCDHGCVAVPNESHPVSVFLTEFYNAGGSLKNILVNHEEVQNNDVYRKLALDIFTRIGLNWILRGENYDMIVECAANIVLLESYGETGDYYAATCRRVVASKLRDLFPLSHKRDVLKFFRKRALCSCLKKMHLEARKTMPKVGMCRHCKQVKERTLLHVCSRCMICQYCSRECQVSDSPRHRKDCDEYVRAHEQTVANTTT